MFASLDDAYMQLVDMESTLKGKNLLLGANSVI